VQSIFKTSPIFLGALLACATPVSAASSQPESQSCRFDINSNIVNSVGPIASLKLGEKYEQGEGIDSDVYQAFDWYCNAAMQKNAEAQLKIALLLLEGKGTARDIAKGMYWLNRSVNNGSHDAELALGILLVDSDALRSAALFKQASEGGNMYANHRLAELYYYGMGVPQNDYKALELSERGVAAGFKKSKELIALIQIKQTSGMFQPQEAAPSVEPASLVKQVPVFKEKIQKSTSSPHSFLAITPSLPNFKNEVAVVSNKEASVAAPRVTVAPVLPENKHIVASPPVLAKPSNVLSNVSETKEIRLARDAEWVNRQPDRRYAIQLVQASQLSGIVKFIKKHHLDDNAHCIHALQDGQYRYILLYGNYPNNQISKKIAKTLPDAVQKAGYWIRTFGDLRRSYKISS
jgi:hypothetical protein